MAALSSDIWSLLDEENKGNPLLGSFGPVSSVSTLFKVIVFFYFGGGGPYLPNDFLNGPD